MAEFVLGDENHSAGIAVEAVHDSRPVRTVEVAELAETELQGIGKRAAPVAFGRVDHHVCRLVDDGQELVFIKHGKRDVLRHRQLMARLGRPDADLIAMANFVACLAGVAVDQDPAGVDDLLQGGPAQVGEHLHEILIQTESFDFALGDQIDRSGPG